MKIETFDAFMSFFFSMDGFYYDSNFSKPEAYVTVEILDCYFLYYAVSFIVDSSIGYSIFFIQDIHPFCMVFKMDKESHGQHNEWETGCMLPLVVAR
jgi:hypothetical protein